MGMPFGLIIVLQQLVDVQHLVVTGLHSLGLSWGLCIVTLTVIVRLCLFPLNYRQVHSMRRMQALQPHLQALQKKHAGPEGREQLQREMVALYQQHGVNPLATFAPFLLQIPIFLSLYYMLRSQRFQHEIHGHAHFLFINDLSQTLIHHPFQLLVLFLAYWITQAGAIIIGSQQRDRRIYALAVILPVLFGAIISRFPAGVLLYWITSNIWTLLQALVFRRIVHDLELPSEAANNSDEQPAVVDTKL
jgi:YidC/Oxa1 family membrane protein insertase